MGTYRQPSQIIDKRFNTLNQGLQNASQTMVNGLKQIRAQEIAMAKQAKKEQEKRDKERKAFEDKRNAAVDGYRVKIDNWEHINQKRTEDWQVENITIENQIKNGVMHYLDIMSNSTEGDENYRMAKRAIENMITQYPVFAQLLNDNAEEVSSAYGPDGNLISSNSVGALLKTKKDPNSNIEKILEIPGVSVTNFMKTAINESRKAKGLDEMPAKDMLKLIKEKSELLEIDRKFLSRSLNEGFSGGEKKRNEIFQMAMLEPKLAILDETDSGLDIDALRIVANGVNKLKNENNAVVVITHYQRLLDHIVPDFVHVLYNGKIVKSGTKELAFELEEKGYDWIKEEVNK